ncbi:plasminogen receptor (KT) isoform X1 [Macrobrachium rosenbergii]|uniref:plasminogen receptor (KT) isoform X1 n=2 Tax=Macrobrachium TaxID=6696 RepID=UPI0034D5E04A
MGNVNKAMNEATRKNQEFMLETQRIQLERQIHMQNEMREKMMSMQIARSRELLYWFGTFYIVAGIGMIAGFRRTRKPGTLVPLLPLSFLLAYQADLAYGSKLNRIKMEAENILLFERDLVSIPMGVPTPSSIDEARERQEESKRLNKSFLAKHNTTVLHQAPCSPDMAMCDFWLSPKLNVTDQLCAISKEAFQHCFQQLQDHWEKCVAAQGDYFEGDW